MIYIYIYIYIIRIHRVTEIGIPLVVTYNPFLCHLGQTIRKNLFLLYQEKKVKFVFTWILLFPFALLGPLGPI